MTWFVAIVGIIMILIALLLLPDFLHRFKIMEGKPPKAAYICERKDEDEEAP